VNDSKEAEDEADAGWKNLKTLAQFYENCVLQNDGIRFKKSHRRLSLWNLLKSHSFD